MLLPPKMCESGLFRAFSGNQKPGSMWIAGFLIDLSLIQSADVELRVGYLFLNIHPEKEYSRRIGYGGNARSSLFKAAFQMTITFYTYL